MAAWPVDGIGKAAGELVEMFFREEFERQRAVFLQSEAAVVAPPLRASSLQHVWWINLARRPDRRKDAEAALHAAGLWGVSERIEATDGRMLDLDCIKPEIATPDAVAQARQPPKRVLGLALTRGALGLLLTWHRLLERSLSTLASNECALILEDDVHFAPQFSLALGDLMQELDRYDPRWEAVQLGYYPHTSYLLPLPMRNGINPIRIRQPLLTFGCIGVVARGFGILRIRDCLFPVHPGQQLDSAFNQNYGRLRVYASSVPLVAAPPSECGDTDIQILGDDRKQIGCTVNGAYDHIHASHDGERFQELLCEQTSGVKMPDVFELVD